MALYYHSLEVLGETLIKVLKDLINQSIVERSLIFNTYQEGQCTFYVIKDDGGKVLALLHFLYEIQDSVLHLKQFRQIAEKIRSKGCASVMSCVVAIGQRDVAVWQELMKYGIDFSISTDQHVIDAFKLADVDLCEDLTLNIDDYIHYLKLSEDERVNLAKLLLDDAQDIIEGVVQKLSNDCLKDR